MESAQKAKSSQPYRVGIIGCGLPWKTPGATGFGMSHAHAPGWLATGQCELVALADIKRENAELFKSKHGGERIYTDYRQMLDKEKLDIVSICTWPHLHAEMVIAAADAKVKAIHCEKPMAVNFGDARREIEAAERNGAVLTFNHQRRFVQTFGKARDLLKSGAIGRLERMEMRTGDLYDWGTHWFDMMFFFNDQSPAQWVIGQIDLRGSRPVFGAPVEGQGLSHIKFRNNVYGLMTTGYQAGQPAQIRLVGSDGTIELGVKDGPDLRYWGKGQSGWQTIDAPEGLHDNVAHGRAIQDIVSSLATGREPELSARRAFQATELIFATWESSRRRGRVDLPLTIDDSPLADMLKQSGIKL